MVWVLLVSIIVTGIWINSSAGFMIAHFFGNAPAKKVHQLLVVLVEWGGEGGGGISRHKYEAWHIPASSYQCCSHIKIYTFKATFMYVI